MPRDNAGLVAAGRAAAGSSGVLLTDSPVAAFYSGKPPSQITGSQDLPPTATQAIAWMRTHGVTELVLENISYYRATAIFPELAAGTANAAIRVARQPGELPGAGGKPVFAYRFGGGCSTAVDLSRA